MTETGIRIGMAVNGTDGEAGTIEDILEGEDGTPRYIVVRDRGVFASDAVLPVTSCALEHDAVSMKLSRAEIDASPRFTQEQFGEARGLFSRAAKQYDRQDET